MVPNPVNEPKTSTFQMRINPEYKEELEALYADLGMTLTQAVNIFFQMSLKAGGLPFNVNRNHGIVISDVAADYLRDQHRIGMESSSDGSWMPLEDAEKRFGARQ